MSRTKIEWADYTWNPVVGCERGCPYCYARRQARRFVHRCAECGAFKPHLHEERITEPSWVRKPSRIFIGSMAEVFAEGQDEWINRILNMVRKIKWHTFIFLTKNPSIMARYEFPENAWCGTTIDRADVAYERLTFLKMVEAPVRFISFEPLLSQMPALNLDGIQWVIIGQETGNREGKVKAEIWWTGGIILDARAADAAVFVKNNLNWPEKIQEFPAPGGRGGNNHAGSGDPDYSRAKTPPPDPARERKVSDNGNIH